MIRIRKVTNLIAALAGIYLLIPATALAISPFYVSKSQSIGSIFQDMVFRHLFGFVIILCTTALLAIPAIIIGYFVHRKYIAYLFFIVYPIVFFIPIIFNDDKRLSDVLLSNIFYFYVSVQLTIIAFFASTLFNKVRKNKLNFSNQDYIPLGIIIAIILILMSLPIRAGHLVCKTPIVNQNFRCDHYLQESESLNRGWLMH